MTGWWVCFTVSNTTVVDLVVYEKNEERVDEPQGRLKNRLLTIAKRNT